jgi:hypothetical protein
MSYMELVACFANSRKMGGRCIAGKVLREDGGVGCWIRPVSSRDTHELSQESASYADGSEPELLDIVAITLRRPEPLPRQEENHLLDDEYFLEKRGRVVLQDIDPWLDRPDGLWLTPEGKRFGPYESARVPEAYAGGESLYLVRVAGLEMHVAADQRHPQRKRVKGSFLYGDRHYLLPVTDPKIEREYAGRHDGDYRIGDAVLCVSLGDPLNGELYKLVAGVIVL